MNSSTKKQISYESLTTNLHREKRARMASPNTSPVRSRRALNGTSGPDLPKNDTKSWRTEPSEDATLKQDHKFGGSGSHIPDGESVTLLEEDPFSSRASKVLFDGMDELRRCGTAVDLDLPQLVIVGQQSAGKSSLLKSLTDIPFPVGDGLCTRFATRIISRRSAPGTSDIVKVSIEKGDLDLFGGQQNDQAEPFNPHVPSITAAVFDDIFKQASVYMGITGQDGLKKINFSSDVLRIELNGPNRSHFGILDVPGVFHALTDNVTDDDMERVKVMVVAHMKKPENVIICVAPATDNLANQQIFTLAKKHAESSRVVGVFTKCDLATNPSNIVRIVRDNKEIALQNGWFVVQNLPEDAPPTSNLQEEERATFSRDPWLEIPAKQRGTAELKKFLANTLSSRIRKAFPELQRKIKDLLAAENDYLTTLGEERRSPQRRREYLLNIVGKYQELARDALTAPDRLPSDAMKLRGLTQKAMRSFSDDIKSKGHFYDFVDVSETGLGPAKAPLYKEIRHQISVNEGEELAIMTNPAVLKPLFIKQSSKWESFGERYLGEVVKMSKEVALLIFDCVSSEFGIPDYTRGELRNTLAEFGAQAQKNGIRKLHEFCQKNSTFLLATTDDNFMWKVKEAQRARFTAALTRYRAENPPQVFVSAYVDTEPKLLPKIEQLFSDWVIINTSSLDQLFEQIHPRATRNSEDEIHDLLRAYYEVARGYFETYVIREVVEEFLKDSEGPIFGLSDKFVLGLTEEQIDILGGEDESVVSNRYDAEKKIERLTRAMKIAGETWKKSIQLEK